MDIFPIGENSNRYYGNLDVPDGGYIGNADGLPLIIFDYDNEALELGGTNITGAGSITATGLTITDAAVFAANSIVFQPAIDSTTFLQINNAAGASVLNADSTNRQVTIGCSSITYPFLIKSTNGSCNMAFYHDNDNAYFNTTDGQFIFITDEGTDTHTVVRISGKGNGYGSFRCYDRDDLAYLEAVMDFDVGYIRTQSAGGPASYLRLQDTAHADIQCFSSATSGETREFLIFGHRTDDAKRWLQIGVGVDAADTASFDGLSNYYFDGHIGVETSSPSQPLSVKEKVAMTDVGGLAVKLTNTTGAPTVQGQTVKPDPATDDAVILTAADDEECIGVFLESGIADDAESWVVVAGIADVAMGDNEATTAGNWVETNSTEAGYADATAASPAAAPQHFNEIGHCIESVAAGGGGTHILARCVLHFN